jgi:biopolymer transport protein ExbD
MAMSVGGNDDGPMMEINTTPLIDVMLVLLIMIIMTIPIQTHAVKVDLPQQQPPQTQQLPDPVKNKLYIYNTGVVTWNGVPVNDTTLRLYLDQTKQMDPEPELHFQPDPQARYEVVDHILSIVKRSNISKLGFVGNEQYRNDF